MKEIYTYNNMFKEIIHEEQSFKYNLNSICESIFKKYNIKICFCEILGKRWSFYAGYKDVIIPFYSERITNKWGIFVDEMKINKKVWNNIVCHIKEIINTIDMSRNSI